MSDDFTSDFYRLIFANAMDGIALSEIVFDDLGKPSDWTYVRVSDSFEALTGLKGAEGKRVTELIPGIRSSNPELFEIYGRVAAGGPSERFETYVEPLKRWFVVSAYSPKINFFVTVFQNVTEEKEKDAKLGELSAAVNNVLEDLVSERKILAETNAKDEALLESIPDGVIATDLNENITHVNAAAETMLRLGAKDLLGRALCDVVPLRDADGLIPVRKRPLQLAVMTGRPSVTTLEDAPTIVRKDGSTFPAIISAAPVVTDRVIGGILVFHDVTREKELDRAKSEFISIASHQLRTPLSTIAWYSESLLAGHLGPLTEAQRKYTEEIAHMDARMIELVNALLSVSRIDLGTFKAVAAPVRLSEVADTVLGELAKPIADRNIRVVKEYDGTDKPILADANIIHIIFQNILSNAVVYNKLNGSVTVRIHSDGEAHVTVTDTGCGIPKQAQSNIFGKFYRADNAREIEPGGTGIGLYIVRSLLRTFGGSVWFESEENKGSAFHALIPTTPPPQKITNAKS